MHILLLIKGHSDVLGTTFYAGRKGKRLLFLCTAHQLGNCQGSYGLVLLPTGGQPMAAQPYPLENLPIVPLKIERVDPMLDLAVLSQEFETPLSDYEISASVETRIGTEVIVSGFPYSIIGSLVLTVEKSHISAILFRKFGEGVGIQEIVVNKLMYPGSSGSPVYDASIDRLIGMMRGCIAPPPSISVSGLGLGSDSNIGVMIPARYLAEFIAEVKNDN